MPLSQSISQTLLLSSILPHRRNLLRSALDLSGRRRQRSRSRQSVVFLPTYSFPSPPCLTRKPRSTI